MVTNSVCLLFISFVDLISFVIKRGGSVVSGYYGIWAATEHIKAMAKSARLR